jgi:hypothetical protein
LGARLRALAAAAGNAPLVTVGGGAKAEQRPEASKGPPAAQSAADEDWEVL